mmetsp:Transcript_10699/g.15757  ORF Transcript_10699/g.15757 Transcript_10699/m.15757 type:complete len:98 (+) Transcript_10699:127-420(+)
MSSQFIQKLIHQLVNQVVVKGLAESKMFQRFAVHTQSTVEQASKQGNEYLNKAASEALNATASTATAATKGPPQAPLRGIPGFFVAMAKEIRKDLSG